MANHLDFENLYNKLKLENNEELVLMKQKSDEFNKKTKLKNRISLISSFILSSICLYYILKYDSYFYNTTSTSIAIIGSLFIFIFTLLFFIVLLFTSLFIKTSSNYKHYLNFYKSIFIKNLINNFYDDVTYLPNYPMPEEIYEEANWNGYYDHYSSEDYFSGKIDNKFSISMSDIHTTRVEEREYKDSNGNVHKYTYDVTVFSGLYSKIKTEKSLNGFLKILPNSFWSGGKTKLEMDSKEFEKYFDIYSSDKIKGMQLLTHDVMDTLLDFVKKGIKFEVNIENDYIYLRFHCGNVFEPGSNKNEIIDSKSLQEYYDILGFTCKISNNIIKMINETEL